MEKIRSKSKKILSVVLSLAMILSAIPLGQNRVFAADSTSGSAIGGGEKTLTALSVVPSQTEVELGAELDTSDMLVTATYSDDSKENLDSDDYEITLDTSVLGTAVATVTSTVSPTISDTFLVDVVPVNGKKVFVYDCETATEALSGFSQATQWKKTNALKFKSNIKADKAGVTIWEGNAISSGTVIFEIEECPAKSCNEILRIYNSKGELLLEITNFISKYKVTKGDGSSSVKDIAAPTVNSGGNLWTKLRVEFYLDDIVTNEDGIKVFPYSISVMESPKKEQYNVLYEGWLDCGSIDQNDVINKGFANGIYEQTIDGSKDHPFDIAKITVQGTANTRWIGDVRLYTVAPPALSSVELTTAPTVVEYMPGETDIDLTGAVITETYEDDSTKEISGADILNAYEVTAFDTSVSGTTTVVLTNKKNSELTVSFDVTVISATLESISIKSAPTKTEYYVGDEVDFAGLVVEAAYSNDSTAVLEADEYTVDVTKLTEAGEVTVTVTAANKDAAGNAVTAEFKVNVKSITTVLEGRYAENYDEMGLTSTEGTTAKWIAYVDEGIKGNKSGLLEVAKGGVVTKVFEDAATSGKVRLIAEYNANGGKGIFYNILDKDGNPLILFGQFSGTNVYEEGSYTVSTKAYSTKDADGNTTPYMTAVSGNQKYWVRFETMIDLDASNETSVLQFTTDIYHKEQYTDEWTYMYTLTAADYSGDAIGHENGCATSSLIRFSVGAVEFAAPSTAGYFDNMYAGVIASEGDTPAAPTLTSIVVTAPTKVEYTTYDTELDLTGLVVRAVYSDKSEVVLADGKYTVSTPDFTKLGAQTITVTAGENVTATFEINVVQGVNAIKSISVTVPANTVVEQGAKLDLSGMQVTATYLDGSTASLTGDDYAVTLDTNNLGTAVATVASVESPTAVDTFLVDVVPADGKKIFVFDSETAEEAPEGFKFYNNGEGTFYEKVNALQFNATGAYSLWNGKLANNKAVFEIELCPASKTDQAVQFYNAAGELLLEVSYIFGGENEIHYTGYIAITDGKGNVLKTVAETDELPSAGGNLWVKLNVEFDFANVITDGAGNKSVPYTVSVIPQAAAEKYDTSAWATADAFTVKDTVAVSADGANLADVKAWCQYKTRCIGDFGLWEVESSAVAGDSWYKDLLEFDKNIETVDAIGATVVGTASIDTSGVKGNADHKLKVDKGGVVTKSFGDGITAGKVKLVAEMCGNGSTGIFYNILDKDGNPLILFGQYSNTNLYDEDSYDKAAKTYSTKYADGNGTPYINAIKGNKAYWIRFETEIDLDASNETGVLQAETKVYHKESYSGAWELKYTVTSADYIGEAFGHANGCASAALTSFSVGAVEYAGSGAAGYFDNMYVAATGAEGAALVGVTVTTLPTVKEYIPGAAALDLTGIVLTEKYSDGTTKEVSDVAYITAKYAVTGFDSSAAGSNTITLTRNNHEDVTAAFDVTIMNATVASIEVTTLPTKVEYFVGDKAVDVAGMVVTATYNNGTKVVLEADDYVVGELEATVAGTVKVTVTAVEKNAAGEAVTTTFDVTVKEPAVTGIKVTTSPYKIQYLIGDEADWTGMVVSFVYENNSTKAVDADKLTITGFDSSKAVDKQTITVAYDKYTTTFDIKVIDPANFTAVEYNFDFNIEGSTTAEGWTGINVNKKKGTKYTLADYGYSADLGYGINTTVTNLQGRSEKPVANPAYISIPADAYSDYVLLGNAKGSFNVDLANGTYNVMIIVGTTSANTTTVKVEDNEAYTGSVTISSSEEKIFKVIEIPNVNVTDGQLNILTTADGNARTSAIIISNVSAPTGVNATLDTTDGVAVNVTWNSSLGCEGYNVYRVHNGVTECIGSVEGMTTTTFKDTKVDCVETYTYFVRGISAKGLETVASNNAELAIVDSSVAAPATPANFKIAAMDTAATTLTWDAVENVSYYEVYGAVKGSETPDMSGYTLIAKVTDNTYVCDVEGHADMYFRMVAVGLGGKSAATDIAFSNAGAPKAPANLKVSEVADYATTLTWDASENAVYYEIYWSDRNRTDLEGLEGYEYVGKSSTTSFVYELSTHVERYFKVVAVGAGGRSDATASVKADIVNKFDVQAEYLDRGLVAITVDGGVYVGWRLLGDEYAAEASYILYRDGKAIRTFDATENTSFLDVDGTADSKYAVSVVIDEEEVEKCKEVAVQSADYLEVPIEAPEAYYDDKLTKEYIKTTYPSGTGENDLTDATLAANGEYEYYANDTYVGDVDGDGVYEIIVKWHGFSRDNSQSGYTSPVYLDCYKLDGTRLWRINLGINIRAGAHYTQPVVADLDGDGKAEIMVRTADGTVDGKGNVIGDATADYRNSSGQIIEGPDFLTLFDGETGEALDTIEYNPQRGSASSWGDNYGGRSERFLSGAAYLDGEHISAIFARGYYTRAVVVAYSVENNKIITQWVCDSNDAENAALYGQGAHSFTVADVDGDGCQEIVYGSATIDNDGKVMYGLTDLHGSDYGKHGDAERVTDMNLKNPGLEIFMVHEDKTKDGMEMHDAATGEYIYLEDSNGNDIGRGAAADIDPRYEGVEGWSSIGNMLAADGTYIGKRAGSINHMVWFSGDMGRDFIDRSGVVPYIGSWDYENGSIDATYYEYCRTNNTTKANPAFQADMFGDWREEVAFRTQDNSAIRIYTSTETMDYRLYTLMHDPTYRAQMACNGSAYNQSPDAGFYIGYDTDLMIVPVPTLNVVKAVAEDDVKVASIEVTSPDKVTYLVGEELDLTGMVVTAIYNNNTKKVLTEGFTVDSSKFDSSVAAEGIVITVTYGEFSDSFVVKVVNASDRQSFYYLDESSVDGLGFTVTEGGSISVTDGAQKNNVTNKLAISAGTAKKALEKAISTGKVTFEHVAYQNGNVYAVRVLDADGNGLISIAQQTSGNYNLYPNVAITSTPFQKLIASQKNKWIKNVIEIDLDKSNETGILHFTMNLYYKSNYDDAEWTTAGVFTQENTYMSAANFGYANGAATSSLTSFNVGAIEFQSSATSYVDDIFFDDGTGIGDVVTATRTLKSIEITQPAAVTQFAVGSVLNTAGLEITGTYEITYSDGRTPETKTAVITKYATEYDFSQITDKAVVKIIVTDGENVFTKEYEVKVVPKSDGSYEVFEYIDEETAAIIGFTGSSLSVTDKDSAADKSNTTNRIKVDKGTATKVFDTPFTTGTVHFETLFMTEATSKASLFLRILNSEGKPMIDIAQYGSGNLNMYIDKQTSGTDGAMAGTFKGLPTKKWAKLSVDVDLDATKTAGHLVFDATVWTTDDYVSGNWTEFAAFDETLYLNSTTAPTTTGAASSDATVLDIASIELYNAAGSANYYDDMFFEAMGEGTSKELTGIEVTSEPVKKEYVEGDNFDATGLVIMGTYKYTLKDGTTAIKQRKITDYDVTFNNRTIGDSVPVVITVGDKTVEFTVKVTASTALNGIEAYIVEYVNNDLVTLLANNNISLNKRQIKLPYSNVDGIMLEWTADSDNVSIENRIMTVTPSTKEATEAVITVGMVVQNADGKDITVKKSVTFEIPKASSADEPTISLDSKADLQAAVEIMMELGLFEDQERLNSVSAIMSKLTGNITVEEFVAILMNLFEVDTTYTETEINRNDIDYDAWYTDYVIAAFQLSVETEESRLGKESFGVGDSLTKEDIIYMLARMIALDKTTLPADYADKMFE